MAREHPPVRQALPPIYTTLGYAGVIPFAVGAVLLVSSDDSSLRQVVDRALVGYGAVSLAFLGAVHWGLMLARPDARLRGILIGGVVPALIGWLASIVAVEIALATIIIALSLFWLYEHRVLGPHVLPAEYLALRRMLTLSVCALLTLALIGGR